MGDPSSRGSIDRSIRKVSDRSMSNREAQKKPDAGLEPMSRRQTAKRLAKLAYVVPAVLAVVKTTERPAFGQSGPPPTPN